MGFCPAQDVFAYLRVDGLSDNDLFLAERLVEDASDLIRAATGQTIDQVTETISVDGAGRRLIQLPQIPVTVVSAVTVDGQPFTADVHYSWGASGVLRRLSGSWPDAVSVSYTHGYASPPPPLVRLCARVASELFQRAGRESGVRQESIASYSVSYDTTTADGLLDRFGDVLRAYMVVPLP